MEAEDLSVRDTKSSSKAKEGTPSVYTVRMLCTPSHKEFCSVEYELISLLLHCEKDGAPPAEGNHLALSSVLSHPQTY